MMQLRFMGKVTSGGDSPTLYGTDRDSYLVQGYRLDPRLTARLNPPDGHTCVEIYPMLLANLAKDGIVGTVTPAAPIVHVMDNGNYVLQGCQVTEPAVRDHLAMPDHEDAIEIPRADLAALLTLRERLWS